MPRRIPGARLAFTYKLIKNDSRDLAQINNRDKKVFIFFLSLIKHQRDKRESRKSDSFGQCPKICYDLPYTHCFAFSISGSREGIVDQTVLTKAQVSLCPKEARVKFYSFNQIHLFHFSSNRKANRAFNKTSYQMLLNQNFYHTNTSHENYENLLRDECRDYFETIDSWHQALKAFESQIKPDVFISKNATEPTKEANKLILSYFYLVSKLIRNNKKKILTNRILALNIPGMVNYFGLTQTTRTQLKYLNYLGYRFFRKLLLQKFSSTPKVYNFIRANYYTTDWRVFDDKEKQLKTSDIKVNGNIPLSSTRLNETTLMANIYLDKIKWDKYEADQIKQIARHKMLQHHEFSLEEFRWLLAASQNWTCKICLKRLTNTELSTAKEVEIDHFPAVHEIKNKIWHKILDDYFLSPNELLKISKENKTDKRVDKLIKDLTILEQMLSKYC